MMEQKPGVYVEEERVEGEVWYGTIVFRASSFGYCQQWFARIARGEQPAPMPDTILTAMQFGTDHEQEVIDRFKDGAVDRVHGDGDTGLTVGGVEFEKIMRWRMWGEYDAKNRGWGWANNQIQIDLPLGVLKGVHDDEVRYEYRLVMRMHLDGIGARYAQAVGAGDKVSGIGDTRVVEVKCMAPGNDPLKNPNYLWQLSGQMHATKMGAAYVVGVKDERRVKIEKVDVTFVDKPPMGLGEMKKRARMLGQVFLHAKDGGAVPACDVAMYPCGFFADHDRRGVWAAEEVEEAAGKDGVDEVELARLVRLWNNAKTRETDAKVELDKWVEDRRKYGELIAEMVGWGERMQVDGMVVETVVREMKERVTKAHTQRFVTVKEKKI